MHANLRDEGKNEKKKKTKMKMMKDEKRRKTKEENENEKLRRKMGQYMMREKWKYFHDLLRKSSEMNKKKRIQTMNLKRKEM